MKVTDQLVRLGINGRIILQLVRFEVFTAVTMKNAVFWDVVSCRSCVNRRRKIRERGISVSR
jgi:hypothetical protein